MAPEKSDNLLALEKRMGLTVEELPEIFPWDAYATWFEENEPPGYTERDTGISWRIAQDKNGRWSKVRRTY